MCTRHTYTARLGVMATFTWPSMAAFILWLFLAVHPTSPQTIYTPQTEISALKDLYDSTNGADWTWWQTGMIWSFDDNPNRAPDPPDPCYDYWQGVICGTCEYVGQEVLCYIEDLRPHDMMLSGALPDSIGNFTKNKILYLHDNSLTGTLPDTISKMTALWTLVVRNNEMTGALPAGLGTLSALTFLEVSGNSFSGSIPESFTNLMLSTLAIHENLFTGSMPSMAGSATTLGAIGAYENFFTGSLPSSLASMINLYIFMVYSNHLSGKIDDSNCLGTTVMKGYLIDYNQFTGSIPSCLEAMTEAVGFSTMDNKFIGLLPSFESRKLPHVHSIQFRGNSLTGSVPSSMFTAMQNISALQLADNYLTGSLPETFTLLSRMTSLALDLNHFTGTLPSNIFEAMSGIKYMDVGFNRFSGRVPININSLSELIFLTIQHNRFTGPIPEMGNHSNLGTLGIGINRLTGTLPESFTRLTAMKYLQAGVDRGLTGTIPDGIGALSNMQLFAVWHASYTGTLPSSIGSMKDMVTLAVCDNRFTGTLPSTLGSLTSLTSLELYTNHFEGTIPDVFSRLTAMGAFLISDNLFNGNVENLFNSSQNEALVIVDISQNRFTGALPEAVFACKSLLAFAAVKNCMRTSIPESICDAHALATFAIDGIGAEESCNHHFLGLASTAYVQRQQAVYGTIPECLFSMPALESLHLAGNRIHDSIEKARNLSESLTSLSLAHNAIRGTIPEAVQYHNWSKLDLSHNEISGYLHDDITPCQTSATWKLKVNRLSGRIPASMRDMENVNILSGNMFSCNADQSDLPVSDPDGDDFTCGSSSVEFTAYAWLGALFLCVSAMAIFIIVRKGARTASEFREGITQMWEEASLQTTETSRERMYRCTSALVRTDMSFVVGYILVLGVLYTIFNATNSTYYHLYAWNTSAGFFSGIAPGVICMLAWAGLSVMVTYIWRHRLVTEFEEFVNQDINANADKGRSSNTLSFKRSKDTHRYALPRGRVKKYFGGDEGTHTRYYLFLGCAIFINSIVVIGANVAYIFSYLKGTKVETTIAEVALSIFKVFWNNVVIDVIMDIGTRHFLGKRNTKAEVRVSQFEVVFRNMIIIGNMVTLPCIVVAMVSPQCFYNVLVEADPSHTDYSYTDCEEYDINTGECTSLNRRESVSASITPAFTYSYQCSGAILKSLAPVFMLTSIIISFVVPGILYIFSYIRKHYPGIGSYADGAFPPLHDKDEEDFKNGVKKWFDVEKFAGKIVAQMSVLISFGAVFPLLGVVTFIVIVSMTYTMQWRYHHIISQAPPDLRESFTSILDLQTQNLVSYMHRSVWALLSAACLFYSIFVFDIFGDKLGFSEAMWAPIVMLLVPFFVYTLDVSGVMAMSTRLISMLSRSSDTKTVRGHASAGEDAGDNGAGDNGAGDDDVGDDTGDDARDDAGDSNGSFGTKEVNPAGRRNKRGKQSLSTTITLPLSAAPTEITRNPMTAGSDSDRDRCASRLEDQL